ncbi:hypothetical protein HDU97_000502 [Phlyctochytrium planicorne]|nr:hypothetical protein HDU97_000502 [Phlyctochytrium planicorne]
MDASSPERDPLSPSSAPSPATSLSMTQKDASWEMLPTELFQTVMLKLSFAQIWRIRAVSSDWKNLAEGVFGLKLRHYRMQGGGKVAKTEPLFTLHFVILSSRHGPWFPVPRRFYYSHLLGNQPPRRDEGVEDVKVVNLYCGAVDVKNQTLELIAEEAKPLPGAPSRHADGFHPHATISRKATLRRDEWILKAVLRFNGDLDCHGCKSVDPFMSSGLFTLITADTDLARTDIAHPDKSQQPLMTTTLTTFEMVSEFSFQDNGNQSSDLVPHFVQESNNLPSLQTSLHIGVNHVKISYSYLFASMCMASAKNLDVAGKQRDVHGLPVQTARAAFWPKEPLKTVPIRSELRVSVFPAEKIRVLREQAREANLPWSPSYWSFDVVLHWLSFGDFKSVESKEMLEKSAKSVINYLKEYENVMEASRNRRRQANLVTMRTYTL